MHAQETRTYAGVATNITVGQAARFALNCTFVGQTITATMTTEAPLAGRATLRGGVTNGLCKLSGDAAEGFRVDFSGTLDARQYGGTYVVTFPGRVQYGTFQTTRQDPPPPLPSPNALPALNATLRVAIRVPGPASAASNRSNFDPSRRLATMTPPFVSPYAKRVRPASISV